MSHRSEPSREPRAEPHDSRAPARPASLRDYAFIADGERGALIGHDGGVAWLCAPGWDGDAVCDGLLGGPGGYRIAPADPWYVASGTYEPGTLIWHERMRVGGGLVDCRDALALPADPRRLVLLRRVHAEHRPADLRVDVTPRAGFGTQRPHDLTRHDDGTWTWGCGGLSWRLTGIPEARPRTADGHRDAALHARLRLDEGEHRDLVLEIAAEGHALDRPPDAAELWGATAAAWRRAVPDCRDTAAPRDAAHAYAVLHGLTSTAGGMVAAATTGLPEFEGGDRNYDYRYAWIRDQCYAGIAVAAHGPHPLLESSVRFVAERVLADGPALRPAYTVSGGPVPDERRIGLPGYPGGGRLVGNRAGHQFQLDTFGEALQLFAAARRYDVLDDDGRKAAHACAAAVTERWTEPDAGIWELEPAAWTHSRLAAAAGLRSFADAFAADAPAAERRQWRDLAALMLRTAERDALHADGSWRRAPHDPRAEAALLLPPVRLGLPADDPHLAATVARVRAELTQDGYVYRFRHHDKPLDEAEGAFLLCGFMLALAEHHRGRHTAAARAFERNRAACGAAGLFTEEYDVTERQPRGNLPQAFVHALFLETAVRLDGTDDADDTDGTDGTDDADHAGRTGRTEQTEQTEQTDQPVRTDRR
ncbi:glycoside hydrolase family 15 protein [Yinghuangia seranimata]|uniref:glycoside hydrolase family 15 protein n=1 Tax=Yinghuangia seranimata TaxID=408067 RepID=UPI00248D3A96|nr:glycoside hydrolase family 15 protein [Yinghuangia seranimata]MDI2125366.1 glycoside hydrolase family 15 protein [Yinghuangia seranimata]